MISPHMAALLAMQAGGRMLTTANTPGNTFGSSLGAGMAGIPQDLMMFQRAAQEKEMRKLRMKALQDDMDQRSKLIQARTNLETAYRKQKMAEQPSTTPAQGKQLTKPPASYFNLGGMDELVAQGIGSGDIGAMDLVNMQQQQQDRAAEQSQLQMQQSRQDLQDLMSLKRLGFEEERIGIERKRLAQQQEKGDHTAFKTGMDPETGKTYAWRFNNKTNKIERYDDVNPYQAGIFGPGGMQIDTKSGRISFGKDMLPSSTTSKMATETIEAGERAEELGGILRMAEPDFFTYKAGAKDFMHRLEQKLGSKETDAFLARRSQFNQRSMDYFIRQRNAMTGAAGSQREYADIAQTVPDPSDSYQAFVAKAVSAKYLNKRFQLRRENALQSGITPDQWENPDVRAQWAAKDPLDNYMTNKLRGNELFELYSHLHPNESQNSIKKRVIDQLEAELSRGALRFK